MEATVCAPGLLIILMLAVFLDGLKLDIKHHVDVTVTAGDVAHLRCPLTPSSHVLQIMWQKLEPEKPEEPVTVATCLRTKHRINPEFSSIFGLSGEGLKDCVLEIHSVEVEDQGCYQCLLITPSDVVHAAKTCLWIQERHRFDPTQSSPEEVAPSSSSSEEKEEEEEEAAGQTAVGSMKQVSEAHDSVHWAVPCSVVGVVLVAGAVCLLLFVRKHRDTKGKKKNVETVENAKTPIKSPSMKPDYGSTRKRMTPQTPRTESHPHSPLLPKKLFIESINENQHQEI